MRQYLALIVFCMRVFLCAVPVYCVFSWPLSHFKVFLGSLRIIQKLAFTLIRMSTGHRLSSWWRNTKNIMNLWPLKTCVCACVCVNVILTMSITLNVLVDTKGQLCCYYHAKHFKAEACFYVCHLNFRFVLWIWAGSECILKGVSTLN